MHLALADILTLPLFIEHWHTDLAAPDILLVNNGLPILIEMPVFVGTSTRHKLDSMLV